MAVAPIAVTLNLAAARGAYCTHAMIASTGTAAHAVDFIAHAAASARAAWTSLPRPAQASDRHVKAMTGGSVTPTVSGNAISGEATARAVAPATRARHCGQSRSLCGDATVKAAATSTIVVIVTQIRVSPSMPPRPAARGRPKSSMTGRYGL